MYGPSVPGSARPRRRTGDELHGLLGRLASLPRGKILLLHGTRGIGKTSLALTAFRRPHVATSEMEPEELLRYARRLGARVHGVSAIRVEELEGETAVDLGVGPGADELVVDSLTATSADVAAMRAVKAWCDATGGRACVVLQHTKDGQYAGSSAIAHAGDVEAELVAGDGERKLRLVKNRFGSLGDLEFALGPKGPYAPVRGRYYSVEGRPGAYRLASYPSAGAQRAAYLEAVERDRAHGRSTLELPDPPVAVAAVPSVLYPGGWVEPEDQATRAAFAEARGVPYFSPSKGP